MAHDESSPGEVWPVKGKLLGASHRKRDPDKSRNVSGIASTRLDGAERYCLVIDDEAQAAQVMVVTVADKRLKAEATIPLIHDKGRRRGGPLELDGEGVAFADGFFYIVGSHGHPRDKDGSLDPIHDAAAIRERMAASSQLVRARLDAERIETLIEAHGKGDRDVAVERTGRLREVMAQEPLLAPFLSRRLDENGLTVEGLAVYEGRLYVGLRAPCLGGDSAAVLSVDAAALFTDADDVRPALHLLRLGPGRGVRDLAASPWGVLVLAGPVGEEPGPYSLYHWNFGTVLDLVGEIPHVAGKRRPRKPEALLYLDRNGTSARVLVFFDGGREGEPRPFRIAVPGGHAVVGGRPRTGLHPDGGAATSPDSVTGNDH